VRFGDGVEGLWSGHAPTVCHAGDGRKRRSRRRPTAGISGIARATPFTVAGARLAFSVSWIGVIVSEVLSSQTADMFVPVLFIAAISVAILTISTHYQRRLTPWASVNL
jgi:hypothetical protein